jgi:phage terminase large subunit
MTRSSNDQAELAEKIRLDPVRFVKDFLGSQLIGKQAEILEALRDYREVYVRSCHDSGKSWIAARAVLHFLMSHPNDSIVITTAPTWSQTEGILWRELAEAYTHAKIKIGGKLLTTRLDLGPKWLALGLSTDTPSNLLGYHASNILVVIDEADAVPAAIWSALDSVRTSANARLLAISNPLDPTSEFRKRHDYALTKADAKCIKISADDVVPLTDSSRHPYLLQRSWVDDKLERWGAGSALYTGKVLAEWADQGDDTLIPISWLIRARARTAQLGPRVLGVDVARFGAARSVRTLLAGNQLVFSRATEKEDTMTTAGRVYTDIETYAPIATAIDDGGVGGAVTDRLRQMTKYVTAVNFGGAAHDNTRFVNRGSEMYWHLRQAFEENLIGLATDNPDAVDELIADLNRPKHFTDERGRIRVDKYGVGRRHTEASLSDEDRVARSPDRGDSFALAYSILPRSLSEMKLHVDDRNEMQKWLDDANRRDAQMLTQGWTPEMDRDS